MFVAEETGLGGKVVIKLLPPETTAQVSHERFKREILLAAKLQHPHILPLYDSGAVGGCFTTSCRTSRVNRYAVRICDSIARWRFKVAPCHPGRASARRVAGGRHPNHPQEEVKLPGIRGDVAAGGSASRVP